MEVCITAKCTYKSEAIMFLVSSNSSMVDVLKTLCLRFRGLQLGSFMLRYSLPGYPSCLLETDSNLGMMRTYLSISNAKSVDILVKDLCGSSEYSGDFCVNKEFIACEKGELSCSSTIEDTNEFLGRSKRASTKPLLLNKWEMYIHHVGQKFDGGAQEFRLKLCKVLSSSFWTWFLQLSATILLPIGRVVTLFSDRNQGLLNAMEFVFLGWPHSYCYYHLKQNLISKYLKSGYGKLLQDRVINLFSICAYAVTEEEFKVAMDELVIVGSSKVKTFISDLSRDHYANAFFKMRYGEMANTKKDLVYDYLGSNGSAVGVVLQPLTKRPAGRPPTKRIKAFGEFTRPLKCSRCSVVGHNRKTCKAVI
ncbi:hypothetical protein L3X38_024724 [Prunus dulcis]|uniref:MULE transposase domain-containing protein n=1 Tax=Prunus dulcis TaxID=3755 RepID=A0AAD4W2V7_PRUDU|nr:hypothetical protein L3X38_024724 [Prunus dulcis]